MNTLYKRTDGGDLLLVCIYVDDIVYLSSSQAMIEEFRQEMKNAFKMTDLGLLSYFLGLEVKQTEGSACDTKKIC